MHKKGRFCNMGPNPGVDFCGVHVAEVVALGGVAPVPPQRTSDGRVEGEKGCGHGALGAKNFLAGSAAAAVAAGSAGAASSAASAGTEGEQAQQERKRKGRDWRERGPRIPCPHDPRHSIYEKELQHHLNNCPMYKQMQVRTFVRTYVQTYILHTYILTYRQTNRQTYRHTDIPTDMQTYRHTYRHRHTCDAPSPAS
jgi:hypothetical protein